MSHTMPKIFILILNWNGKKDTCECLKSVRDIDYPNYEVAVMDNGSQDNSVEIFRENFPEVTVIENKANLGFAEGNNRGMAYALEKNADFILLLNNDAVVDPHILKSFVEASENNSHAGIFGAKIYYLNEPKKIWFAGGVWLPDIGQTDHEGMGQPDDGQTWEKVKKIDYACGCALFIKAEVIKKIGMLEQKFFLTWEETDFSYRARSAGFECLFIPTAIVWHKVSASFSGGVGGLLQQYFMSRNRLLWMERNLSIADRVRIYRKIIFPELKSYIRSYLSPKSDSNRRAQSKVNLIAYRDYFFRRFGDCPKWIRSAS
jgi:GT2 family glycosyltransferase